MDVLDNLSRPNSKYIQDKLLQEVAHSRTKGVLALQGLLIIFYIIKMIEKPHLLVGCIIGILFCILIAILTIVSCRVHPEIFNIIYNLLVAAYGPFQLYREETEHFSWNGTQTYPVIVLLATGSIYHCLLQGCFQIMLLKTVYEPRIINSLISNSPAQFGRDFSHALLMFTPFVVMFSIFMQITLSNAYAKIMVVEKKKEEIERQKVFLLGFSHELRNLINSIMGNINLATLENTSNKAKDLLTNAEFCGKLLLHLVNNILDTGKAEIGDLEINLSPTKIYDTMENIWSICSELIKRKCLRGTMTIQKNIPHTLNMDHYRLTQIFLNLIGNAVKFTEIGSINIDVEWIPNASEVTYETFEPKPFSTDTLDEGIFEKCRQFSKFDKNSFELDLTHRKIDNKLLANPINCRQGILKVIVSDTGHGIDEEDVQKLFQKFTQVSSDSSKRKLGTGLGLFITKELCNKMGGKIKAFSRTQEGTCFIFCLPIEVPLQPISQSQPIQTGLSENSLSANRLKAMIVDDLSFCRDVLKSYLQKLDIEVVQTAINGSDAYQKFLEIKTKKKTLNIITMDLDMPIMNGKESARLIREFEVRRGLEPCFMMIVSGNCGHAEIEECLDKKGTIRADVFLKKPVTINDLSRAISHHICSDKDIQ